MSAFLLDWLIHSHAMLLDWIYTCHLNLFSIYLVGFSLLLFLLFFNAQKGVSRQVTELFPSQYILGIQPNVEYHIIIDTG